MTSRALTSARPSIVRRAPLYGMFLSLIVGCAGSPILTGTVISEYGYRERPDTGLIPGTQVRLYIPGSTTPQEEVVADAAGRYRIHVPRGSGCYGLYFAWVGHTNALRTFQVPASNAELGITRLEATAVEAPLATQLECPRPDLIKLFGGWGATPQPIVRRRWPT